MCNACGFGCCAYDGFSRCGCEDCEDLACHPSDCMCIICDGQGGDDFEEDETQEVTR